MPKRKLKFAVREVYHLFNRGVNCQRIFLGDDQYRSGLARIEKYVAPQADVLGYCLMPNHYHLIVSPKDENLSKAMRSFGSSLAQAHNDAMGRGGPLFESRFKAVHVDTDDYLRHLSRYVHLNPVRAGLVKHPGEWEHSSYREYASEEPSRFLRLERVLELFRDVDEYITFVNSPEVREPRGFHVVKLDAESHLLTDHTY